MLRQLLEHRSIDAVEGKDYLQEHHGPVNRMFGTHFWSRKFGSAGFNRHLLHHWDPSISYTCFDEMEKYLLKTEMAEEVESARTSYLATLRELVGTRHK